jgi:hypothetical protein
MLTYPEDRPALESVEIVEKYCHGTATEEELIAAHKAAAVFAKKMWDDFMWINHKLGDSADGWDYEHAAIGFHMAAACAAASAPEVDLADCSENVAQAIGFRWDESEQETAVQEEKRILKQIERDWKPPV